MNTLSTGADSTLEEYRKLACAVFGADSPAVAFLDKKIAEDPKGAKAEVIQDEGQMVCLLGMLHLGGP